MDQYLRKCSLVVSNDNLSLDLSELRITFRIKQADMQSPNSAEIRVYNLSDATANKVQKEFTEVILQVGYEGGPLGVIFSGSIVQVRRGVEAQVNTYLDLICADGDEALNFATVNTSIAAGATYEDRINAFLAVFKARGVTPGFVAPTPTAQLPRGRVYYGMARDHLRVMMVALGHTFSVQNGKYTQIPLQGYLDGEAVVMNSRTGMLGIPEQTQGGIRVKCLINPQLGVGSRLQINQKDIAQAQISTQYDATVNVNPGIAKNDGIYKIYVIEHTGDTRGEQWESDIICLSIDPTVSQGLAVTDLNNRGALAGIGDQK